MLAGVASLDGSSGNHLVKTPGFDLAKAPECYREMLFRPDAPVWKEVMRCEWQSLSDMDAFTVTTLSLGWKAIGVQWVFAHKYDIAGLPIAGKEKARLVVRGFSQ